MTWEAGNYRLLVLTEISSGCSARWWFYWWCWIRVESKCAATGRACRIELGSTELCLEVGLTSYVFQSWSNWHRFLFFNIDFFFFFWNVVHWLQHWIIERKQDQRKILLICCHRVYDYTMMQPVQFSNRRRNYEMMTRYHEKTETYPFTNKVFFNFSECLWFSVRLPPHTMDF